MDEVLVTPSTNFLLLNWSKILVVTILVLSFSYVPLLGPYTYVIPHHAAVPLFNIAVTKEPFIKTLLTGGKLSTV